MSELLCANPHGGRPTPATGRVRSVLRGESGEHVSPPLCDACQVEGCTALRRNAKVSEVGAVPLDYAELRVEAYRSGRVRRLSDEMTSGRTAPEQVAEDVVAAILAAMEGYRVPGLSSLVSAGLDRWHAEQDEGRAEVASQVDDAADWF